MDIEHLHPTLKLVKKCSKFHPVDDVVLFGPRRVVVPLFREFAQFIQHMGFELGDSLVPGRINEETGENCDHEGT